MRDGDIYFDDEIHNAEQIAINEFGEYELWNLPPTIHAFRYMAEVLLSRLAMTDVPEDYLQNMLPSEIITVLRWADLNRKLPGKAAERPLKKIKI
ncbi:hypothetical protein ACQ4WY_26730 [Janthinobacterium sp. LB2P49]|uniref:hypothetical protein n=1 Tax=Janthinobacterium sp. LB2P49 TaxID=3424198 RepID=UPI003F1FFF68